MKWLKLFESFEDIHSICRKYEIENYIINSDGSIDVDGDVGLYKKELTELPLKFRNVSGYFQCGYNQISSLEGSPSLVGGEFWCGHNKLTSLEGGPTSVGSYFNCSYNQLTSLEGGQSSVGGSFDCSYNQITSFEGCPNYINGFYCEYNPIWDVWKLFQDYSKMEFFNDCDIIRDNKVIILDRLNYFLEEIGKPTVKSVKGYKCI